VVEMVLLMLLLRLIVAATQLQKAGRSCRRRALHMKRHRRTHTCCPWRAQTHSCDAAAAAAADATGRCDVDAFVMRTVGEVGLLLER